MQCRCTLWLPCLVHRSGYSYIDKYKSTLPHENNMFLFCIHFAQMPVFCIHFRNFAVFPN